MKKIFVLTVALFLIPFYAFAGQVPPGTPFQALQEQINQLKIQLQNIQLIPGPPGPAGEGAIKVYDATNQYLGIYAGLPPGAGALMASIFNPDLKLFFSIILDPNDTQYGQILKGNYYTSAAMPGIFVLARDKLYRTCNDKYYYGTGNPIQVSQVTGFYIGCYQGPAGDFKGFETSEISSLPFTLPIAMPLKYE
jgi:hypothetical protein